MYSSSSSSSSARPPPPPASGSAPSISMEDVAATGNAELDGEITALKLKVAEADARVRNIAGEVDTARGNARGTPVDSIERLDLAAAERALDAAKDEYTKLKLDLKELQHPPPPPLVIPRLTANAIEQQNIAEFPYVFVETKEYSKSVKLLTSLVNPSAGAKPVFPAVVGGVGMGKTFTAIHAAKTLAEQLGPSAVVLLVDLHVILLYEAFSSINTPDRSLALALLTGCFGSLNAPEVKELMKMEPTVVYQKIRDDLNASTVVMVLDEFQFDPPFVTRILRACNGLLVNTKQLFRVIPIMSGVVPLGKVLDDIINASTFTVYDICAQPFTWEQTLAYFSPVLNLTPTQLDNTRHVKVILSECGGVARLLRFASEALQRLEEKNWKQDPPNGKDIMDIATAEIVYGGIVDKLAEIHNEQRWRILARKAQSHDSLARAQKLVRRLALAALAEREVSFNDDIIDGVTFQACVDSGLISKTKDGRSITIPLIAIEAMSKAFADKDNVIPNVSRALNPFQQDYEAFERLTMLTLWIRLAAERAFFNGEPNDSCWVELNKLRPGAECYLKGKTAEKVMVKVPTWEKLHFRILETAPSTFKDAGEVGVAAVLSPRFPDLDGAMTLECTVNGAPCFLRWLSQTKWAEAVVPSTGATSRNPMTNADVAEIIPKMRDQITGGSKTDFTVLDVFSDKAGPKTVGGTSLSKLAKKREYVFVTRGENFDKVVGESVSGRKRLRGMWKNPQKQ